MEMRKRRTWVIVILVALAAGLYFLLPKLHRTYILQAFKMPSASMVPTLLVGDYFLVDKSRARLKEIKRGDIIIFSYPPDPRKIFVKRLIGLPGDAIEILNKALYINGVLQEEQYAIHTDDRVFPAGMNRRDNIGPIEVPENSYFVLGDNRDASNDSRFWGFVELSKVKGRVATIYWSWDKENTRVRWDRIGKAVQ